MIQIPQFKDNIFRIYLETLGSSITCLEKSSEWEEDWENIHTFFLSQFSNLFLCLCVTSPFLLTTQMEEEACFHN